MSTRPATLAGLSVEVARRRLAREFREQNIDAPALDARIIVGHVLGLDHTALMAQSGRVLAPAEADAIAALAARRRAHEPIARMLGYKEFWGLPFKLNSETLLPRPETETVVEAALAALDGEHRSARVLRIVDLGTGSGALLLALLSELPERFRDRHGYQRHRARLRARQCRRAWPFCPCVVRGLRLRGSASTGRWMFSSPIHPTWRARRSPTCSPKSATTILAARSMAARMGLMDIAKLPRMPAACSRQAGCWRWNSGGANSAP